jgi:hypothetical protein
MKEYSKLAGIRKINTIAYSKEENAIVERANKEVMRHLRAFIFDKRLKQHWYKYVPFVQRIINSTVHSSTGVSPSALVFGNAFHLDKGIFDNFSKEQTEQFSLSEYSAKMLKAQQILLKIANEHQYKKDSEHLEKRTPETISVFPPNSYVLVSYPDSGFGPRPPNKLMTNLKGPYRVIKNTGADYTLLNLVNNKTESVHIKRLKPFLYDPRFTDPADIANRDDGFENVETVLKHKGDLNDKKNLEFLVKWEGCPESENSWLPWKELRSNEALHNYLRRKNLTKYIPKEFL